MGTQVYFSHCQNRSPKNDSHVVLVETRYYLLVSHSTHPKYVMGFLNMQILHYNNDFEIEKMCLRNWCALGKHLGSDLTSKKQRKHSSPLCLFLFKSILRHANFRFYILAEAHKTNRRNHSNNGLECFSCFFLVARSALHLTVFPSVARRS